MTDRDLLREIHASAMTTAASVGELHGRLSALEASARSIATEVTGVRQAQVQQGLSIAALPCAEHTARMQRQSEEIARLGGTVEEVREDTGVLHVDSVRRKTIWWTVAKIAGALLALAGLVTGALGALRSCAGVAEVRAKIEKRQTVRVRLLDQPWCLSELAELRGVLERRLPHGEWMRLATEDVPWPKWR